MYCADVLSVRNRLAEGAATRRPDDTAAIVVRSVNFILSGSLQQVSYFVRSFRRYSKALRTSSKLTFPSYKSHT